MASIINAEGKIVSGTLLTEEETEILQEITEDLQTGSGQYIPERHTQKIALHLITKYRLARRVKETAKVEPPADEPAPEPYSYPEPAALTVAADDPDDVLAL